MAFAMGTWCRDLQPAGVINGVPANHTELADQTGTTASTTFGNPVKYVRAVVYVKGWTSGGSATFHLQVSESATNYGATVGAPVCIDTKVLPGSVGSYSFILQGFSPDQTQAGSAAARLLVIQPQVVGLSFDAIIDGL